MANIPQSEGLSRSNQIRQLTGAYGQIAIDLTEAGWLPYLLVFKYRHLRGRHSAVLDQMHREAVRAYDRILTRVWRKPYSTAYQDRLPRWILVPDLPVRKHGKADLRADRPNGGLHLQGVAVMPPSCRLGEGLDEHLRREHGLYCPADSPLLSLSATPILSDVAYVNEYNFKTARRGMTNLDDVLLLPRSASERKYASGEGRLVCWSVGGEVIGVILGP